MNKDECIFFRGEVDAVGYGMKWSPELAMVTTAHRAAWIAAHGLVPAHIDIAHKCEKLYAPDDDTYKRCINLEHLAESSRRDNLLEAYENGRMNQKGERNGNAKYTPETVLAMRRRRREGATVAAIAEEFQISRGYTKLILLRRVWPDLVEEIPS